MTPSISVTATHTSGTDIMHPFSFSHTTASKHASNQQHLTQGNVPGIHSGLDEGGHGLGDGGNRQHCAAGLHCLRERGVGGVCRLADAAAAGLRSSLGSGRLQRARGQSGPPRSPTHGRSPGEGWHRHSTRWAGGTHGWWGGRGLRRGRGWLRGSCRGRWRGWLGGRGGPCAGRKAAWRQLDGGDGSSVHRHGHDVR